MIETRHLTLTVGRFTLKHINLNIKEGEILVLVGPTGAGKTILLECIAGLRRPLEGQILVNGKDVTNSPPEQRKLGYVPQDYKLFPHLNVFENIAFGLRSDKYKPQQVLERVKYISDILGIMSLLERAVHDLSGGEKQRVSLARAISPFYKILLLDEPMGNLDHRTAKYLRMDLKRILHQLNITVIYVTHDLVEAEELADRIALIHNGQIQQISKPQDMFFSPERKEVFDFFGMPNVLECDNCRAIAQGLFEVNCKGMQIVLPHDGNDIKKIAIFPSDIYISTSKPPGPEINRLKGIITNIQLYNSMMRLKVIVGENAILTEVPKETATEMGLEIGQEVFLILKLKRVKCYQAVQSEGKFRH
jgi:ABC-type sugar transport system ATPase subunit